MTGRPVAAQLDLAFDGSALAAEFALLRSAAFREQGTVGSDGRVSKGRSDGWTVLALRSPGGDPGRTDPGGPGLQEFADTPHMALCPELRQAIHRVPAPLRSVRLMALAPGPAVGQHTDTPTGFDVGFVRLHIPIVTNPSAVIRIDGQEQRWQPGSLWFGDFQRPHDLWNHGEQERVHCVIDCEVTSDLLALLPAEHRQFRSDQVVLHSETVPLLPEDATFIRGAVRVPAAFLELDNHVADGPAVDGCVEVRDDVPILQLPQDVSSACGTSAGCASSSSAGSGSGTSSSVTPGLTSPAAEATTGSGAVSRGTERKEVRHAVPPLSSRGLTGVEPLKSRQALSGRGTEGRPACATSTSCRGRGPIGAPPVPEE